jgi:N-carbamoyl-L-amino-acid hydrolase
MTEQHKPNSGAAGKAQAHVSQKRILDALAALARFGGRDDGGVARPGT